MTAIPRGIGITDSERYLTRLAERTFLRLWSYPNLFIDKKQNKKGTGKEFCDLLVVFGRDIIIFSDKKVGWSDTNDVPTAWTRWFRKAVSKSSEQIKGAERWLGEFPDRIFLDATCSKRLPIRLPPKETRRVHGIVVATGAAEACKRFVADGTGTLAIAPSIKDGDHTDPKSKSFSPFSIGDVNQYGSFIHVFDEKALDFIMRELNTVSDFVHYLNRRERFIRSGGLIAAPGEEDLIGYYLQALDINQEHDFVDAKGKPLSSKSKVVIERGHYRNLVTKSEYRIKQQADQVSFLWDRLIEDFIHYILEGTSVALSDEQLDGLNAEQVLRIMAAEPRVLRRVLSERFLDALKIAEAQKMDRFARTVTPGNHLADQDVAYIFMITHPAAFRFSSAQEARLFRVNGLHAYCLGILEKNRHLKTAVGIAIDVWSDAAGSRWRAQDIFAVNITSWTAELEDRARELKEDFNILEPGKQILSSISTSEYPSELSMSAVPMSRQQRRALERKMLKKRKRQQN